MLATTSRPVRLGAVSYLNSKPLIEGLQRRSNEIELMLDYPSCLADDLAARQLDVALVPSIEVLSHPGHEVVSDACVASRGPVLSVKLYSRVAWGDVRRLALDTGSRTSAALAQIMLAERHGVRPQVEPLPMGESTSSTDADAVLLIGDRAMSAPNEAFEEVWDLGEEWREWTGLPFVFALWAKRIDVDCGNIEDILNEARDRGVANLDAIARREAAVLGISETTAIDYLTNNLHFQLGPAERSALRLFYDLASKLGLAQEGAELVLRDFTSSG